MDDHIHIVLYMQLHQLQPIILQLFIVQKSAIIICKKMQPSYSTIQHKHLHNDGCPTDTSLILMYNDAYTVCKFAMYIPFTYVCFHESVGSFDIRTVPVLTAADFASTCDWSYQCGYLGGSVMARDVYLASSALGND